MFVIPWTYAPVASKLGIVLKGQPASHSSVRRASLCSAWLPSSTGTLPGCPDNAQWKIESTPDVLLKFFNCIFFQVTEYDFEK
jgi:hypothetical protein